MFESAVFLSGSAYQKMFKGSTKLTRADIQTIVWISQSFLSYFAKKQHFFNSRIPINRLTYHFVYHGKNLGALNTFYKLVLHQSRLGLDQKHGKNRPRCKRVLPDFRFVVQIFLHKIAKIDSDGNYSVGNYKIRLLFHKTQLKVFRSPLW